MSSYLLLRNNQESGPFAFEEVQAMPLKSYDLIWVVGKSAAWRYPGEILELRSFAPPVPEQITDQHSKKQDARKQDTGNANPETTPAKKPEITINRVRENNGQRITPARSVYVNLPAEKKPLVKHQDRILFEMDFPTIVNQEPAYDFSDLYKKRPSRTSRFSGKVLGISTIALLFGAGILTGFFISDRRNFFSKAEKTMQKQELIRPVRLSSQKGVEPQKKSVSQQVRGAGNIVQRKDSAKTVRPASGNLVTIPAKKSLRPDSVKKDSLVNQAALLSTLKLSDSLRQTNLPKADILYDKIKAHPENYVSLVAGRYSTGVFGGISSFPVTLTNNSPVMLNLVVVTIDYIQNNEKIFKTESLSFSDLEPGESVTLKAPKSQRGIKITTSMHLVNSRQPDLSSSN